MVEIIEAYKLLIIFVFVLYVIFKMLEKKTWIKLTAIAFFSIGFAGGYLSFPLMPLNGIQNDFKVIIPLIASIIASFSLIVAIRNSSTSEEVQKREQVLNMVKFTRDIIKDENIKESSREILKELHSKLDGNKLRIEILVNTGARFCYKYLHEGDNKEKIITRLKQLKFQEGTLYDKNQIELLKMLESEKISDMRNLWILINYLSGQPAIDHKILTEKKEYKLTNEWIGRGLKRKHGRFYTDTILKKERNILRDMIKEHSKQNYHENAYVYYEDLFRFIEKHFKDTSDELGHYLRTSHRTLKLINHYFKKKPEEYKMQIGLLRAQIPNNVSLIMFYNAFFTKSGLGMGRELQESGFFGTKSDFTFHQESFELKEAQHFHERKNFATTSNAHFAYNLVAPNKKSGFFIKILSKLNSHRDENQKRLSDTTALNDLNSEGKKLYRLYEKIYNLHPIKYEGGPFELFDIDDSIKK